MVCHSLAYVLTYTVLILSQD